MTSPLPALEYDAPPVNPAGYGLLAAATVIETGRPSTAGGARIQGGVIVRPYNCALGFGTWEADPCATPDVEALKTGDRADPSDPFLPLLVWAYDECDPQETDEQTEARARQTLRLREGPLLESHFAARLMADDGVPSAAGTLIEALGLLEVELGETGYNGVIHASRKWAAVAANANLIVGSGAALKTPLGNTWAFGGGYESVMANTITATGPVTVWRDEVSVITALDARINRRASVAERYMVAGYECLISSVTITAP